MQHITLNDEEISCINSFLSSCNTTLLSPPFQVMSYPRVTVNKNMISIISDRTTSRNNHTVVYTDKTCTAIQYGTVKKLITVSISDSEPLHLALVNRIEVGPCQAFSKITFPAEVVSQFHILTMDFVSVIGHSTDLIAISTDNIIMKLFDLNGALCPLVHENEK